MEEYFEKTKSKGKGLSGVLFIFIVICIFLTGFDYRQAYHRWNEDSPYRVVGVLQLTLVVVAFVVVLLSFLSFSACSNSRGVILLFIVLNSMSMLFTICVSFFTLIAGSIGGIDKYLGCQTKFKRIFKVWNYIDQYMFAIDRRFCSEHFQCELTPYTAQIFKKDPIVGHLFQELYAEKIDYSITPLDKYKKEDDDSKRVGWEDVQTNNDASIELPKLMEGIESFKYKKFNQFWRYIENKFDCSGFCSTVYQYEESKEFRDWPNDEGKELKYAPRQIPIFKYLFSDVNKGIPKHRGCMKRLLRWLPQMLITFGSFALAASLLQFILFFLSLQLMGQFAIPSNPKSNSQVANLNEQMNKDENKNLKEEDRK